MKMSDETIFQRRALVAVTLWFGFNLLAFGLAGVLLLVAYTVLGQDGNSPGLAEMAVAGSAFLGSLLILWSSFPRWERFVPPGPRLDPAKHPHLFDEIRRLARDIRQHPPSEVYLDLSVNAGVYQRSRWFGLFPRRVLNLGLPLVQVLTVSQLRGVLAHEFGHFAAGDTRLGPWIYRTYAALHRTVDLLEGSDSLWRFPFLAYAKLFTRLTRSVSQRQELAADALAVRLAGGRTYGQVLRRMEQATAAFGPFVVEELLPAIRSGYRPPVVEGFSRFLRAKEVSRAVVKHLGRQLAERKRDPHRTHPPLPERLAAIAALPPGNEAGDDSPSLGLLGDYAAEERDLLATAFGDPRIRDLPATAWEDLGERAYLPPWRESVAAAKTHLAGITPIGFPELKLLDVGRRMDRAADDAGARGVAINILGAALVIALRDRGWKLRLEPGERPALLRESHRVEPFHVFLDFAEGKLLPDGWRALCDAGGFGGVDLGA